MNKRVPIELTRDDWIALLTAVYFGADEIAGEIGDTVADHAERVVDQLKDRLGITNIIAEATDLEAREFHDRSHPST